MEALVYIYILPTAFVIVLSWIERRWVVSMIGHAFRPRHADKKGAVQPVALQQLLWLWVLWVLLPSFWLQLLWPPGQDHRHLSSGLHHRHKWKRTGQGTHSA